MTLVLQPPTFPLEENNPWRNPCSEPQLNCSGTPAVRTVAKSTSNMMPLVIPGSPVGKRKLETPTEECEYRPPSKRISPFLNTPKQRRDERRKLYRISMNKLRDIDDSETFLRRSVLINNLARRMQKELRDEKNGRYPQVCTRTTEPETMPPCARRSRMHVTPPLYMAPPISPLPASIFDDAFSLTDKITDDMSETLMRTVDALGGTITSATSEQTEDMTTCTVATSQQQISPSQDLCSPAVDCSGMTERDRQILGEMDAVFNSLLSMFAESVGTQHGS